MQHDRPIPRPKLYYWIELVCAKSLEHTSATREPIKSPRFIHCECELVLAWLPIFPVSSPPFLVYSSLRYIYGVLLRLPRFRSSNKNTLTWYHSQFNTKFHFKLSCVVAFERTSWFVYHPPLQHFKFVYQSHRVSTSASPADFESK